MNNYSLYKDEKNKIELQQYEVLSGRLLDETRELLVDYRNALLADPNIYAHAPEIMRTLVDMQKTKEDINPEKAQELLMLLEGLDVYPTSNEAGINAIISLAIAISDKRQLKTEDLKYVSNVENWKGYEVDIEEVARYVQSFRFRVGKKPKE